MFYDEGYKKASEAIKWLHDKGIESYEYQAGHGLTMGTDTAKAIKNNAETYNITLSVHAPYYISISSAEEEKRNASINYIASSVKFAERIGAYIAVVHSGSTGRMSREDAFKFASDTMTRAVDNLYKNDMTNVQIGIETMGKENQLGTLEEVIELCKIDKILYPVVDFGHLYARSLGKKILTCGDYLEIFEKIGEKLSDDKAKYLHCHFAKIEYTAKGEKKHLTFENKDFGPAFEPLAEVLVRNNLYPNIICESDGTMDTDALYMKEKYMQLYNK